MGRPDLGLGHDIRRTWQKDKRLKNPNENRTERGDRTERMDRTEKVDRTEEEDRILWSPSPERVASSGLAEFANLYGPYAGQTSFEYDGLHRWSIEHPRAFWESIWEFGGVIGDPGETAFEPGADMRTARFFPGATLNFAENLLRRSDSG